MRQRFSQLITPAFLTGTFFLLGLRLFVLIDQKSVNILFWDQWDFLTPLFQGKGPWELFNWQHGLHRMGIGYFLIQALAQWTHWNTRADSFAILALILLASLGALVLKKRLFGSLAVWDVLVIITFLTASQYEIFIGTPDESAAAFPLLLIVLLGIGWTVNRQVIKIPFLLVTNFLTLFTGYGFLAAPITSALFGFELFQALRIHSKPGVIASSTGLVGSIASILIFMNGYVFYPSAGCPNSSLLTAAKYPVFTGLSFAKFVGFDYTDHRWASLLLGIILVVIFGGVFISTGIGLFTKRSSEDKIRFSIVFLMGFSLLFSTSAAIGRTCLGMNSAQASRYMTLLIPAFLGLYLFVLTIRTQRLRWILLSIFTLALLIPQLPYQTHDQTIIQFFSSDKQQWKLCYLKFGDVNECDRQTRYQIYPFNDQHLQSELDYLKKNHLNLYLDDPVSRGP